jgi:hypothetical protein
MTLLCYRCYRTTASAASSSSSSNSNEKKTRKLALITGTTDGIGKHTARRLVEQNIDVIVHGRSQERIEKTVDEINKVTGKDDGGKVVGAILSDLSSLEGVEHVYDRVKRDVVDRENRKLDIVVQNAGEKIKREKNRVDIPDERVSAVHVELFAVEQRRARFGRLSNIERGVYFANERRPVRGHDIRETMERPLVVLALKDVHEEFKF